MGRNWQVRTQQSRASGTGNWSRYFRFCWTQYIDHNDELPMGRSSEPLRRNLKTHNQDGTTPYHVLITDSILSERLTSGATTPFDQTMIWPLIKRWSNRDQAVTKPWLNRVQNVFQTLSKRESHEFRVLFTFWSRSEHGLNTFWTCVCHLCPKHLGRSKSNQTNPLKL